jgi:branched-chain amino acid aminotransferase
VVATSDEQLWVDGSLRPTAELSLSPLDHGVTVGDGVFETMRTERGEPFAVTRHLARLRRSATGLGLDVPYTDDELRAAIRDVLSANGPDAGRVRVTLTGGIGPLGSDRSGNTPTVLIASTEAKSWPESAVLLTVPWRRNEHSPIAGLKTTSYAENVVALERAHSSGADEAIFANTAGQLCEGTGTNIFVGIGGRLITPPLSSGCLAGITRELVVELTGAADELIAIERLADVDEAFITSSTRDVQAVSRIDDRTLPGCPGPLTIAARAAFATLVRETTDP